MLTPCTQILVASLTATCGGAAFGRHKLQKQRWDKEELITENLPLSIIVVLSALASSFQSGSRIGVNQTRDFCAKASRASTFFLAFIFFLPQKEGNQYANSPAPPAAWPGSAGTHRGAAFQLHREMRKKVKEETVEGSPLRGSSSLQGYTSYQPPPPPLVF